MRSFDDRDNSDHAWSVFLTGACLGAAGMYLLDPNRGARRRGVVRDQFIHAARKTADGLDAARRDLAHRAQGTWAEVQSRRGATNTPDRAVIERLSAEFIQREWSPAARTLAGSVGSALVAYAAARRDVFATLFGLAGTALVLRAATNLETTRLVGIGAGRRAVDLQKTITVNAPVSTVFAFWSHFENFPQFMTHVRDVRATSIEGQSHWTVAGPAGVPIEFDAVITRFVPNEIIAWKTVDGAAVAHAGIIRFEPDGDATRVHIRFSYNPPAGAIGHAIAGLLGDDPKSMMDDDLARMKTLIETGNPPRDAAQPIAHAPDNVM